MSGSRSPGSYMNIVDQEVDSTMDVLGKNAMATEWTDEKHGLYLKSMEASFVNQLYDSINSQGGSWQIRHDPASGSSKHINTRMTGQFKVHQNGSWQKLNFERPRPHAEGTAEHQHLLENPWIRHFRSGDRQQDAPFRIPQETTVVSGSHPGTNGFVNMPQQLATSSNHQVSSCNNEEASGQNFIDVDDDEHGEDNVSHRRKRSRTSESRRQAKMK
ncbi:hypothetical protein Droror1_Dr00013647 [Drosera rotundifolia]